MLRHRNKKGCLSVFGKDSVRQATKFGLISIIVIMIGQFVFHSLERPVEQEANKAAEALLDSFAAVQKKINSTLTAEEVRSLGSSTVFHRL
jgi:hypothetical protein